MCTLEDYAVKLTAVLCIFLTLQGMDGTPVCNGDKAKKKRKKDKKMKDVAVQQ